MRAQPTISIRLRKMASASVPRGVSLRALSTILTRTILPNRASTLKPWRALSAASYPMWKWQDSARNSRLTSRPSLAATLALRRSSTVTLTVPQLEEQVLSVLKMFDKVKPEKVRIMKQQ